jgi:hypothetical protein
MAEYCVKCKKKIGFWEEAALYITSDKPMCKQCAQPIVEYFDKFYDSDAEKLADMEAELSKECEKVYDVELALLIVDKFHKRRIGMGLLTEDEKQEKNKEKIEFEEKVINLPMTTTPSFEGYKIQKYIKVVSEEIIFKNSLWKSIGAGLEDLGNAFSFK